MKTSGSTWRWARSLAFASFVLLSLTGNAWAALQVWVQPSGNTFANAYTLVNEPRTFFGRVEGGSGTYNYSWAFSDGPGSATGVSGAVYDPRYISVDGKAYATAGTHWARLTVSDANDASNSGTAQIDLQVVSSDDLGRQKNSAIDRGLRNIYLNENINGSASYWNGYGGRVYGATGMALVALENQGHNLQSADSDIYKKSVQRGLQFLLNGAYFQTIDSQRCIGNPETASQGDTLQDGWGVRFGGDDLYGASQAMLAVVNSADEAFARAYVVGGTGVTGANGSNTIALDGMSLYNVAIEAKDWMAWAQGDGGGGGTPTASCAAPGGGVIYTSYSGSRITNTWGYFYTGDTTAIGGMGGTFNIDWGDGSAPGSYVDQKYYDSGSSGYPEFNWNNYVTLSHAYATSGNFTVNYTYAGGTDPSIITQLCSTTVQISGSGASCGAADAANGTGGWRYSGNYSDSDNSVTQWPALALNEAKNRWRIDTSQAVKDLLGYWLGFSQCSNGAFGYTSGDSSGWCNFPKSAGAMISLYYAGKPLSDAAVQKDLNYLSANWTSANYDGNFDNLYSMYALYKGLKVWGITDLGSTATTGQAWQQQYDQNLVNSQVTDGSWNDSGSWMDNNFATYAAVAILAPSVASLPPVANAGGPYQTINAGQVLTLDGSKSYHKDSAKSINLWRWDFDASDGLWWTSKSAPAAGEGAIGKTVQVSYADVGQNKSYAVTLQVSDNTSPTPLTATDTAAVNVSSGEVAPVAKTNGPWSGLPNVPVTFDASASYDPNDPAHCSGSSCLNDAIVQYEWDLNGDGIFNNADGSDGVPLTADWKIVKKSFPNPISLPAKLRVTDKFGKTSTTSATNNIVSIAVVYGQTYTTCYKAAVNGSRFVSRNGLSVVFKNLGTGTAQNLEMTLVSVPSNMTILHGRAEIGTLGAGAQATTTCNSSAKTADIELQVDTRIPSSGGWAWKADFDFNGTHYSVDNIPPVAQ